ncbi:acyltransferase family protein [Jeotgalibaca porci]|uniref:acyltransferase family protein n=1 Tax=Jeotgalibaca porci TaxID=1868793 RepID=UPI003F8E27A6
MNRLSYLDYARGLGIVFIVYGHVFSDAFSMWVYSFHVPLFFVISGCIANHRNKEFHNWKEYFYRRVRPFIFPYLVYSVFHTLTSAVIKNQSLINVLKSFVKIILLSGAGTMWFLPVLIMAELLFYLLLNRKRNSLNLYIIAVLVIASFAFNVVYEPDFFIAQTIIKTFVALGFYAIGYYGFKPVFSKRHRLPVLITCLILSLVISSINGMVDLNTLQFSNVFLYFSAAVLGTAFIIFMCHSLEKAEILESFGKYSLTVMGTHLPIALVLKNLIPSSNLQEFFVFVVLIFTEFMLVRFKKINRKSTSLLNTL